MIAVAILAIAATVIFTVLSIIERHVPESWLYYQGDDQ